MDLLTPELAAPLSASFLGIMAERARALAFTENEWRAVLRWGSEYGEALRR